MHHPESHSDYLPPRHFRMARPSLGGDTRGGFTDHLHEVHARKVEVFVCHELLEVDTARFARRLAGGLEHVHQIEVVVMRQIGPLRFPPPGRG